MIEEIDRIFDNPKIKILLIASIVILIFTVKASPVFITQKMKPLYLRINEKSYPLYSCEADIESYIFIAEKFSKGEFFNDSGWNNSLSYVLNNHYKFPPLYPILLIPSFLLKFDISIYISYLNEFLASITFIPLFFFARKFLPALYSLFVSIFPLFMPTYIWSWQWSTGMGIVSYLYIFLFASFIYFLYTEKHFLATIFFALMMLTHFVTVYFIFFLLVYFYAKYGKFKASIYKTINIASISLVLASLWFLRNGFTHGFTMTGVFGAYACYFERFFIYPQFIDEKLLSFFNTDYRWIYTLVALSILIISSIVMKKHSYPDINRLSQSLSVFAIFLFFATGFMYASHQFTYKFLFVLSPFFLFISVVVLLFRYLNMRSGIKYL